MSHRRQSNINQQNLALIKVEQILKQMVFTRFVFHLVLRFLEFSATTYELYNNIYFFYIYFFYRSEIQNLIELLHSRISKETPSDIIVDEMYGAKISPPPNSPSCVIHLEASSASCSLRKRKDGDESDNFHTAIFSSRVVEEQIASPATIENLPEEILSSIFIRLLAKQLAQMRSVKKSWNAILSRSSFIKSHLNHSIHNNNQILLIFHGSSNSQVLTTHSCRSPDHELTNSIKLPINPQFENPNVVQVIGSVNGLICYSHSDSVIHIWNPSLSAVLTLPPYSMPSYCSDSVECFFRFGFDPKTDDYKVVKLTGLISHTYGIKLWLPIEIYSMRKGSWEFITERFPSHITNIIDADGVCTDGHDGHLHWLGYIYRHNGTEIERIVAFDLGLETFHEIQMPDCTRGRICEIDLGVLSGKLCVMSFYWDDIYEVWVMDELVWGG
ncbi:hypothetical protein LXL04_002256 [Taraxacum kok-saghyz]